MRLNYYYSRDYILTANFLVMLLLPLVLISVMNTLIFLTIRRSSRRQSVTQVTSRQRRDRKVAMLLVTVVVIFIGCNMIRVGINTYEVRETIIVMIKMLEYTSLKYFAKVFHLAYFGDISVKWPDWFV